MNIHTRIFRNTLFASLLCFFGPSSAQEPLATAVQNLELVTAATPQLKMPFEWSTELKDGLSGYLDVGLGSDFSDHFTISDQPPKLLLHVTPKQKNVQIRVRQRSVTYLNVSGEGPHISIDGTDIVSSWVELRARESGVFPVMNQVPQELNMPRSQIVAAINEPDPKWVEFAKTCGSADDGACYTVTDTEFEISIKKGNSPAFKGIVRVLYPNGC